MSLDLTYRFALTLGSLAIKNRRYRLDIVGAENLPSAGGAVLAMNHLSYFDFAFGALPAWYARKRFTRYLAKQSIFANRFAGPPMRWMRHIPVDRDAGARSFKDAVKYLKAGEFVGVFPEATMSRTFDLKQLKSGTVRMAQAAGVPIVPMAIFGTHRIYGYSAKDSTKGRTIAITVGEPWWPERSLDTEAGTAELARRLTALLDQTIERYPAPLAGEDAWWLSQRHGGSAPTTND